MTLNLPMMGIVDPSPVYVPMHELCYRLYTESTASRGAPLLSFAVGSIERASTTHWQVYLQLAKPKTLRGVKSMFKSAASGLHMGPLQQVLQTMHLEIRSIHSNPQRCYEYCTKLDTSLAKQSSLDWRQEIDSGTLDKSDHPKFYCKTGDFHGTSKTVRFEVGTLQHIRDKRSAGHVTTAGPSQAGKRNDLTNFVGAINDYTKMDEIFNAPVETQAVAAKYFHFTKAKIAHQNLRSAPRRRDVKLYIFWGDTGTGKTTAAMDMVPKDETPFIITCEKTRQLWFDGYEDQSTVIFDEFDGANQIDLATFNRLTDGWPMRLPIKNSHVMARYTTVILTSNLDPSHWWDGCAPRQVKAFERRVTKITPMLDPSPDNIADSLPISDLEEPSSAAAMKTLTDEELTSQQAVAASLLDAPIPTDEQPF
jgi:hypothetical protein